VLNFVKRQLCCVHSSSWIILAWFRGWLLSSVFTVGLVARCSQWWSKNTAGHSQQQKTKLNPKTLQNPKTELWTPIIMKQELTQNPLKPTGDLRTGKSSWALLDTHRTSGSKSKSRKDIGTTRGQLSAPRPRNFSTWTRKFSARTRNFLVQARKLARNFRAACFQQPEPTKKQPKLDQTNSDWAQNLWRYS